MSKPETTFLLRPHHSFASEIRRILQEQTALAHWYLSSPEPDVDEAVHEVRKCFKRLRGVLRLVRDEIGEARFAELNALFRDAGRQLSDIRTSAVLDETLEEVHQRYPQQLSDEMLAALLSRLQAHHQALHEQLAPQQRIFKAVVADLEHGQALIKALPLRGDFFPARGMQRVYRRGRRGLKNSRKTAAVAHLHEWRKRVKYLRYHMRLFSPTWPPVLGSVTEALVTLSDWLGLDHDLAELHRTLQENPELCPDSLDANTIVALIEAYRAELEAQSFSLGARLYIERPQAFVLRMQGYWRVWREDPGSA